MALGTGWFKTSGRGGGITDGDGRMLTHTTGGIGETQNILGTVAAPGLGVAVATLSGLTVGAVYSVEGVIMLTGTAETVLSNLRIQTNGLSFVGGAILPTMSGLVVPFYFPRFVCLTGGVIRIVAAAAATAGSVYTISLRATQVE